MSKEINPLQRIYEINEEIANTNDKMQEDMKPYIDHIKELEEMRNRWMETALTTGVTEKNGFKMETVTTYGRKSRVPIVDRVIAKFKAGMGAKKGMEEALKIADFKIKDLERVFGKEDVDLLCDITQKETVERRVIKL